LSENVHTKVQNLGLEISHFAEIWGQNWNFELSVISKSCLWTNCNYLPPHTFLTNDAAAISGGPVDKLRFGAGFI